MNGTATISLSLALAFGAFASPQFARAIQSNEGNNLADTNVSAQQEAAQMVAATVDLKKDLDARKLHPGDHFEAVLQRDVQLKNGPRLDKGTVLLCTVTTDQLQPGNARLAFRFTRAQLKNGQTIPIKATVVQIAGPLSGWNTGMGRNVANESGLWSPHVLQVDQMGAASGVSLHSAIASRNSAVLESKKDDVKLRANSQIVVAISAQSEPNSMGNGA